MRLDQELLGYPLFAGVQQTALRCESVSVEAGAKPAGPMQGHLKIVSSCLNIGNAKGVDRFLA